MNNNVNSQPSAAEPTERREEKVDNSSPQVKPSPVHEGPDNNPPDSHDERATRAEEPMPEDAKGQVVKDEGEDGKRYKKALREGAKVEDDVLKAKMKELERLQRVHKQAAKDEAAAVTSHSKAIKNEHKLDMSYLSARSKHESALADMKAKENVVSVTKRHTEEQGQRLQEKQREIEELRGKKAVEDRERESKIKQFATSSVKPTSA